jgi:hypothetical protein
MVENESLQIKFISADDQVTLLEMIETFSTSICGGFSRCCISPYLEYCVQIGAWCMSSVFLWETCCTLLCHSRLWYYATVCRHALADLNLNKGSVTSPYVLTQTTVDVVVVH